MEEYDSVGNVDNLLFQLVLQTRELSQKKDEVEKQIERCKLDIAEKKTLLKETKQNIEKLEEDVTKRENLMKYYKINSKRLKATNNLLMQYEKTLQHDLERKQEIFNHDVKMFQERIETYRKVFEEHQARYFENSLVQKLMSAQAENDGIEQRIRACEEQIVAKGRELQALQDVAPDPSVTECASGSTAEQQGLVEHQGQADPQAEASASVETGFPSRPLTPQQDLCLEEEQEDGGSERVETLSQKEKPSDEVSSEENATPSPPVVPDHMDAWLSHEAAGEVAGPSQEQTDAVEVQEEGLAVFGVAGTEQREGRGDVLKLFSCGEEEEQGGSGGFPQNPPARMSAVQTTPTFSLRTSPCGSPGPFKPSEGKSPTFFFSMSMTPETAQFPGFGCSFEGESPKEGEDIPFSFTSSYFENRKLLDSKSSGFLMDQMESQADEEFELFFSNKSPNQTSAGQKQGEASDAFFFNFGQP